MTQKRKPEKSGETATLEAPLSEAVFTHAGLHEWEAPGLRTMREFAADEIELADGERVDEKFDPEFQRWTGLLLDLFDAEEYSEYWISGPRQTGKTLLTIIIPMMYYLFERKENCIFLAPTDKIAHGIYKDKVLPIIERSAYAHLLPTHGPGARGGRVESISFRNKTSLRFFGAGKHMASTFTARCIFVTEASKMEAAGAADGEADPISAVKECASSFVKPVVFSDCIMTSEAGIVWNTIYKKGTASQVVLPCPHCGEYQHPERDGFKDWQGASDEKDAEAIGIYYCVACGVQWSEEDRMKAIDEADILHDGQSLDKNGERKGQPKPTNIMGLQWNALCSALRAQKDIAAQEWKAQNSAIDKDEQALCQYVWALPYVSDSTDLSDIDAETIAGKLIALGKGVIPDLAESVILVIDLGGHIKGCNWAAGAFYGRRIGHIFDYGVFHPAANSEDALEAAVLDFWMSTISQGWAWKDGVRKPDLILIDSGWKPAAVYSACNIIGRGIAKPVKGYGRWSDSGPTKYSHKERSKKVPRSGDHWHEARIKSNQRLIHIDGDYYKRRAQECFTIATGQPGSMTLFHVPSVMHMRGIDGKGMGFARHMVAEREVVPNIPGQGQVRKWEQMHKANDWLDCAGYMLAGADYQGVTIAATPVEQKRKRGDLASRRVDRRRPGRRGR